MNIIDLLRDKPNPDVFHGKKYNKVGIRCSWNWPYCGTDGKEFKEYYPNSPCNICIQRTIEKEYKN